MQKSKFSETQIITILKAVEAGNTVRDVCREHEISDATFTSGRQSTAVWKPPTFAACVSWKKRTAGSSTCTRNYLWSIAS
jgi:hypothetical protein